MPISRPLKTRALILGLIWAAASLAWGAGGGILNDPTATFTTEQPGQPPGSVRAWVRLQSVQFRLNAVNGKYRLVPIVVENHGAQPLALSGVADRVTLVFADRSVPAILELFKVDRPFWDSLDLSLHKSLSYPTEVAPEDSVMIYAFVKAADVREIPQGVDFMIQSLGSTLKLRQRPAAAA
jgi:hypothetical protein